MPQAFDSAASRCTPPARPRAGLRPSGCVWSGHGLPCASAAWPDLCLSAWLDAFHRAPDSGAAGVSFALGFRAWLEDTHQGTTGGALLFRKRLRIVELTAPGGSVHGKRQRHPIQIKHLEHSYLSVTCRGKLAEDLWKNCGMVSTAAPAVEVRARPRWQRLAGAGGSGSWWGGGVQISAGPPPETGPQANFYEREFLGVGGFVSDGESADNPARSAAGSGERSRFFNVQADPVPWCLSSVFAGICA